MIGSSFNPWKNFDNYNEQMFDDKSSDRPQWPIKLWQVPDISPYFHHAHLLMAADCSTFTCPTFHDKLSKGKVPFICCPATDFDISYHKVMDDVSCFDQGNGMRAEVLKELGE